MESSSRRPQRPRADPGPRPDRGEASYHLKTLGDVALVRVSPGDEPEEVLGPGKPLAVIVYLASAPGRSASREHLIDLLWANLDLDGARHGLRQTLWYLRKHLGAETIITQDQQVSLSPAVRSDRDRFLEAIDRKDFERAVELYEGEFLPMFAAPGGADFESWGDMERFRLRVLALDAAEAVAWKRLEQGDPEGAKSLALRMRDTHPVTQRSWRLLLEVLVAANDSVTARIEAEALERRLEAEDRSPDAATRQLLDTVRNASGRRSAVSRDSPLRPELIGREREFARIVAAWKSAEEARGHHIHLRGPAGIGKTRLLEEIANRLEAMGAALVHLRAAPGRQGLPYSLVSEMAGELAQLSATERISKGAASVLAGLNPALADRLGASPRSAGEGDIARQRDMAMAELLGSATAETPLALCVDDTHWADAQSLELLGSLSERVPNHRILLITTARATGRSIGAEAPAEILSLEPLSSDDVAALLASLGSLPEENWTERFPENLRRATGGSPLLILETLRFVLERGLLSLNDGLWLCPDPDALRAELARGSAVRRRVEELPERQRRLLLLLCVAGTPLPGRTLARAVGEPEQDMIGELDAMEVRGLVAAHGSSWSPAHDELGRAVMEAAGSDELLQAHRRVGLSLAEEAGEPAEPADGDLLLRAVRHLCAAEEETELGPVYDRWVREVRRRGDRRRLRTLTTVALGDRSDPASARRLTRSLPLATRLGISSRGRVRTALVLGTLALLAWTGAQVAVPPTPPPDALLLVLRPGPDGNVTGYQVPVRRDGWDGLEAIDVTRRGRRIEELSGVPIYSGHVVQSPDGGGWAYAGVVEESWAPDLFLVANGGASERMSRFPGEDVPMAWSPDGRSLLFQTSRWNPNYWQDLAILDLETGDVRPLVRSDDSHGNAHWSPDGTRVMFQRHRIGTEPWEAEALQSDPRQVCWVTVDGQTERCLDLPLQEASPVGWIDTDRVLVRGVNQAGVSGLYQVRLNDGDVGILHREVLGAQVSPDGRWLAVLRGPPDTPARGWYVSPVDRPELAVPVVGAEGLAHWPIRWGQAPRSEDFLESLEIVAPDTVMVDVPMRLRAHGYDPQGRSVSVPVLAWQVDDTTVATFDGDSEVLIGRAPGMTTVRVSAGGWRDSSFQVSVVPPSHAESWTEDWSEGLERRWVPFGNPRPSVTDWPRSGRAFWNRGDGFHHSGVYSREEFRSSRGLGLDAEISTPRTGPRAQGIGVGIYAWTDPEASEAWDHRTGSLLGGTSRCDFMYPTGDGTPHFARAFAASQRVELDPAVPEGEPYTVRVQTFPDGTCGVAVNAEPVARADLLAHDSAPDRIVLRGESLNSRILVGPIEVWEGVRNDIDWSALRWNPERGSWER